MARSALLRKLYHYTKLTQKLSIVPWDFGRFFRKTPLARGSNLCYHENEENEIGFCRYLYGSESGDAP